MEFSSRCFPLDEIASDAPPGLLPRQASPVAPAAASSGGLLQPSVAQVLTCDDWS